MAQFPTSLVGTAQLPVVSDSNPTNSPDHAGIHNNVNAEVIAIETVLGTGVAGTDGTVKAKLIRIDGQSSGAGFVPTSTTVNGHALTGNITLTTADVLAIGTSALSTDGTMSSDSNNLIPSQKAVVTYVTAATSTVGSGISNVSSANADIQVANPTTTPVLTLNSGTAASQILKLNGSAQIPAVSGALLTNLPLSYIFVPTNIQVFTTTGTWTKPAGVSNVYVKVIGQGGTGGSGASGTTGASGAGGGGGGYAEGVIAVTGNVTVTIGSTNSFAGSTTISATAGTAASAGTPGTGGSGSNGTINLTGANGQAGMSGGTAASAGGMGGGTAMGPGGGGGLGGAGGAAGSVGGSYGGGGGGGGGDSHSGGSGDVGAVIVYY